MSAGANGVTVLDLVEDVGGTPTSRLGIRNVISITTGTGSQLPETIIELPATWDASNIITINGVVQTP
jgi:hypothetical protein